MTAPQTSLERPAVFTPDFVRKAYARLEQELEGLSGDAQWEAFYLRWNALKCLISGEHARRVYTEAQDVSNQAAEEASRVMREEVVPVSEEHDARIREAVLASASRAALEARFGTLLFSQFQIEQEAFCAPNIPLNVEASDLATRYERALGTAEIEVDGETLTLSRAGALLTHPEETKRKAAWEAISDWTFAHGAEFHGIYSGLVRLRQAMATNLGEADFIPVGYRKMRRLDYGPQEVATFREGIKRHIVPLLAKLRAKQAAWLGVPSVKPWNMSFFPGLSLPPGVAPIGEQMARAEALFDRLHPKLGGHFRHMAKEGLIDLENRPGKRPGAFCTSFDDTDQVVIFCNSTGNEDDVSTLTHEMGHAFQGWESRWIVPLELRWPSMEACEIHSMGMEFLALHELDAFFSPEDARKFRKLKLIDTLTMLPYIAVVDAFQHWVYAHPEHSLEARDAEWDRLWDEYLPGVDFSGLEAHKAVRWKRQAHIFADPFYYIDYAIAESAALQLWRMAEKDRKAAMATYMELCRIGGSQSLLDIFSSAGLVSPFDPEVFAPSVEAIAAELEL
ncbi:MAG TPA: M3 family oligoendopeptidase [Pantanalinema sp.]